MSLVVGSRIKVIKGIYEGVRGIVSSTLTIPLEQIWPLVDAKEFLKPDCSIVLYAVELEDGTGVTLPLDCIEFIDV